MPITKSFNSKANAKQATNQDLPFNQAQPVIARYPGVATAGQTVIALTFSQDTTATDAFFLFINGVKQYIGQDFNFTAIASDKTSSQITMTYPLLAGQAIEAYKLGLKKESEFQTDNRFVTAYDYLTQAFQGFVSTSALRTATSTTGTPGAGVFYSSIQNRAPIVDISQDLKASFGIERIQTQQLAQLQTEFGPNGESVFGVQNDDRGLIRFVGNWNQFIDNGGQYMSSNNIGDYVEVTFYGTGINVLARFANAFDVRLSVDGGTEAASSFFTATPSSIIAGRNYSCNTSANLVSGLVLGVHTIRLRVATATFFQPNGFEILNANSATSLNVNPGSSYIQGQKLTSASAISSSYNSTFEAGTLGTKGGHVVVYQKSDGTIGKAITPTSIGSAFTTSADHTNEEIQRVYHWREFGAGRTDDFSIQTQGSASNLAFTLDDGTTSLVGNNVANYTNYQLYPSGTTAAFITFTFVGTGVDFVRQDTTNTTSGDTFSYTIDGTVVGTVSGTGSTIRRTVKIASGLPYGTHTFKIARTSAAAGWDIGVQQFIVYQPKKPAIPSGSVELSDYNVMATYSFAASVGAGFVSTGALRKLSNREFLYSGTWSATGVDTATNGGQQIFSNTSTSYFTYTFFGTGVEYRFEVNGGTANNQTVSVDGITNLSGSFTVQTALVSGVSFNAATGAISGTAGSTTNGNSISITGLALGVHTIKILCNGPFTYADAFDVITPIYSAKSNTTFDQQNTLLVGSNALSDNRKTTALKDLPAQKKNVSQAFGVTSSPTTTSTVYVPMADMSVTHLNTTGRIKISYSLEISSNSSTLGKYVMPYIDGVQVTNQDRYLGISGVADNGALSNSFYVNVGPGYHYIQMYWQTTSGTITALAQQRTLLVEEI
jgi:hypothetical protein